MTEDFSTPIAKAVDVESVRFSAPDLSRMQAFLEDFGMSAAQDAGDGVLRMRGTGPAAFLHETVEGEPGFVSLAMTVRGMDDLKALASLEGSKVEPASGPGGGYRVRMSDPDGFLVDAVAARLPAPPLPKESGFWNVSDRRERIGAPKRIASQPAHVARLGHVVLGVSDMTKTWEWWRTRFGLLTSDEVRAPNDDLAALFLRCDRGDDPADHHTLNFASVPGLPPKFHHAAFEVADFDDLMAGSEFLASRGHVQDWGIGRHILGSQVFDYWRDPWGHRVEHWTDGDLFDANEPANVADIGTMLGHQWGPAAPADFAS